MNLQFLTLPAIPQQNDLQTSVVQDLVTVCWERELLQFMLSHFIKAPDTFRCLSIGDSHDALYLTLSQIKKPESRFKTLPDYLIDEKAWQLFMGLHTDSEIVESLNNEYRDQKKVRFFRHDYRQGLGLFKYEKPFDWYWIGIEATQYCSQESLSKLLTDVLQHAHTGSIIGLDFVGKYNTEEAKGWCPSLLEALLPPDNTNLKVHILKKTDRSIVIGQARLNKSTTCLPIRDTIQDLLTQFLRTDLTRLILKPAFFETDAPFHVQAFFAKLQNCWNALVNYTILCFDKGIVEPESFEDWEQMPSPLKFSLKAMQRILQDTEWIGYGDVRANNIEPHLAYALRTLEHELQDGAGAGQYFTVLLQVE